LNLVNSDLFRVSDLVLRILFNVPLVFQRTIDYLLRSLILHTLQSQGSKEAICISMGETSFEELLNKEWLLTNKRGSYASSTIAGCNTRRYHGLLIGSLTPPAGRVAALSNCLETIRSGDKEINLSSLEFDVKFVPESCQPLRFRQDVGVHFDYKFEGIELTKSLYLLSDFDSGALVYDFLHLASGIEFELRPFVNLRDYHSLQKSGASISSESFGGGLLVQNNIRQACELFLSCPGMNFNADEQWWYNVLYRRERERGQDFTEDLWTPGVFKNFLDSPQRIVFWFSLKSAEKKSSSKGLLYFTSAELEIEFEGMRKHQEDIKSKSKICGEDSVFEKLCLAADKFVVKRSAGDERQRWTILAGFPWFCDWGRDAFMSLPGLLLSTGRYEEAKSVLLTFAQAEDGGMIANYFDEQIKRAEFNSIDASLWFIHSAFQYLKSSGDDETFEQHLLPVIHRIVDCYSQGTRFGIRCDEDGLICGGDENTQLTWMDARFEGVSFTPRYGKAVEVNALWYNCLCYLARYHEKRNSQLARRYRLMAEKCEKNFRRLFWNQLTGYLNDCILPDGRIDSSLRPNQIFAVSLPFSPLEDYQAKSVVNVLESRLLTPYGLRSLDALDSRYKGTYSGPSRQRDEAYHQGTVWPYLIGPFVEAYLKVNGCEASSKKKAAKFIEPLLEHMTNDGCIGQISEIFDGDEPHKPRGCFAQAWSVAEVIRAYLLINS